MGYLIGCISPSYLIGRKKGYDVRTSGSCNAGASNTVSMSVIWPVYYGTTTGNWAGAAILAIPFVPIFIKHTENFRRISRGEELRLSYLWEKGTELERIGRDD